MPPDRDSGGSGQRDREFIAAARQEAAELSRAPEGSLPPTDSVPGYTILREIGRGGMGVIYEAQQEEPPRPVALKIMRGGGTVDRHRLMLFRQEVETLARLNNPHIAAIYGAGRTDDERQFFAMELVRGAPLIEHVRLRQLELPQQLRLFRRVCEAIHYAHQRGVIHRDLKPSNIIVDADGNPKVVDFGLARITDTDEALRSVFTESGKVMGTLPYMSPEQARGEHDEIDIRTDIYSLGVILYELLTDRLPYDLTESGQADVRRAICETPPHRPSAVVRAVRGDLETIVLKALEKDPARRYQSAAVLGEDIDRFLTNWPILAHRPSVSYPLRKFVARHKLPSAFVGTLIMLVAGIGIWRYAELRQREADEQQRQREVNAWRLGFLSEHRNELLIAEREREKAQQNQEFWERVVVSAGPRAGGASDAAVQALLDRAAERVESELRDQPEVSAAIHDTLGRAYTGLGQYAPAEEHLRRALTIRRALLGESHPQVAETLAGLAEVLMRRSEFAAAQPLLRECLEIRRSALGDADWRTAHTATVLGGCLTALGHYQEAELLLRGGYPIMGQELGDSHQRTREALKRLVDLYEAWGRPEKAAEYRALLEESSGPQD